MMVHKNTGKKILFVCTGNTCRSPMAAALARRTLQNKPPAAVHLEISSAGLAALPGEPASAGAVRALQAKGLDLGSHRASSLAPRRVKEADLVLTMTSSQSHLIRRLVPEQADKIYTLAEYAGAGGDVPDPIGGDDAQYCRVADRLEELVQNALQRYLRECGSGRSAGSGRERR